MPGQRLVLDLAEKRATPQTGPKCLTYSAPGHRQSGSYCHGDGGRATGYAGSWASWIGTRTAAPEHPVDVALKGVVGYDQGHAATADDQPFRKSTWKKANPGLDFT